MRVFLVNELGPEFKNFFKWDLVLLIDRNPRTVIPRSKIRKSLVFWNAFETILHSNRFRWRNLGYWNGFCDTRTDSSQKQWLETCCWTDQFCWWSNTKIWYNQTGTLGRVVTKKSQKLRPNDVYTLNMERVSLNPFEGFHSNESLDCSKWNLSKWYKDTWPMFKVCSIHVYFVQLKFWLKKRT